MANTVQEGNNKHLNKSLICVPMKTPGIHLAKKIDKLGMRSSDTGVIYFDNVRVSALCVEDSDDVLINRDPGSGTCQEYHR